MWSEEADFGEHAQFFTSVMMKSTFLMDNTWRLALPSPSSSKYSRAVTTTGRYTERSHD